MQIKYGLYAHQLYENWYRYESRVLYSEVGLPERVVNRMTIWGEKKADTPAAITAELAALEAAYSANGSDLIVYLADGTTPSQHQILNAGSIDGTQVKSLMYLDRDPRYGQSGVEYQFKRTYQIVLEAVKPAATVPAIVSWVEKVTSIGTGGPKNIYKSALTGSPQKQTIQLITSFKAFQSGRAVGWTSYPTPATPLWAADEHTERRQITLQSPQPGVNFSYHYPIEWRYEFERNTAFSGTPTVLP